MKQTVWGKMGTLALLLALAGVLAACGGGKTVEELNRESDALVQEMKNLDPLNPADAAKLTRLMDKGKKLSAELEKAAAQAAGAAKPSGGAKEAKGAAKESKAAVKGAAKNTKPAEASDFVYKLNEAKNGVVITGIQKDAKFGAHLVVPSEIEGYPVVAYLATGHSDLAASMYRNQPPLESVVLPDTITYMGAISLPVPNAYGSNDYVFFPAGFEEFKGGSAEFGECKSLKSIVYPKNVTVVAGLNAPNLSWDNIRWPEKVEVLGGINISTGSKVVIPTGVKYIMAGFNNNPTVTEVVIPEGVLKLEGDVFKGCKSLTTVTLPDSLVEIYGNTSYSFQDCPELTTVNVSAHPIKWNDDTGAFRNCPKLSLTSKRALKATGHPSF